MSDKFINGTGLGAIRTWLLNLLAGKQDTLVSGTNIKTVNGTSILGSGNVDTGEVFIVVEDETTYQELSDAIDAHKVLLCILSGLTPMYAFSATRSNERISLYFIITDGHAETLVRDTVSSDNVWSYSEHEIFGDYYLSQTVVDEQRKIISGHGIKEYVDSATAQATDTTFGTVKTNSAESVTLSADGQLQVGGRLGQFPNGGVFYPTDITPSGVGTSSFLMTDGAKDIKVAGRTFAIMAGMNITCKSAAAGSTQYRVSNTYANRFLCCTIKGGRIAIDQNDAISNGTAYVESVKFADGTDCYVHFGAAEPNNDIIITASRSINPSAATTKLRGYGTNLSSDNILVGQGVAATNGKAISLGQATMAGGNQTIALGNSVHVLANNSVGMGHTLLVNKQYCFGVGQGHDFTNGANGTSAVGVWSEIDANTRFVVGVGTSTERKNAFEVLADGRAKSSGTPTENDDLATKAYVDSAIGGGGLAITTYGNADFSYEQVIDPDTQEVTNECVAYSTVAGNAEEPKAVKYGRIVNMAGAFKNINARASNAVFVMGKVPAGCEPLYRQCIMQQGSSQAKYLLTIETDGTLKCARYSTAATALAVPNNAWLNINATYIAAS